MRGYPPVRTKKDKSLWLEGIDGLLTILENHICVLTLPSCRPDVVPPTHLLGVRYRRRCLVEPIGTAAQLELSRSLESHAKYMQQVFVHSISRGPAEELTECFCIFDCRKSATSLMRKHYS
jgi:hypothetical protein